MKIFRTVGRLCLPILLCAGTALAQVTSGRMTGTVVDSSGAAIAKATVTFVNENTGAQRIIETGDDGTYLALALDPAAYDVKVFKDGFARSEVANLIVGVGQTVARDFVIQVSQTETRVIVEAGSQLALDTSSAKIGATIANREIENLPINGRQISQLYLLVPGATNSGSG